MRTKGKIALLVAAVVLAALISGCKGAEKPIEVIGMYGGVAESEAKKIVDAALEAELMPFLWVAGNTFAPVDGEPGDKLIAFDLGRGTFRWDLLPEELIPTAASEVGAVVLIESEARAAGTYSSGATGYVWSARARIVDPYTGLCLDQTVMFEGGDPPAAATNVMDQYGEYPGAQLLAVIRTSNWRETQRSGLIEFEVRGDGAYVTGYRGEKDTGLAGWLVVPEKYEGVPVVGIDSGAFDSVCYGKLHLPSSLREIGGSAFHGAIFEQIELPDGLRAIGGYAFHFSTYLREIDIPDNVYVLGDNAFDFCTELECVSLPAGLRDIPAEVFHHCVALTQVELPEELLTIGERAFSGCGALETLTIPASVTSIGVGAFNGCDRLTLRCAENSAAHRYALENDVPFELTEETDSPDAQAGAAQAMDGVWLLYMHDGDPVSSLPEDFVSRLSVPIGLALYADGRCCGLTNYETDGVFGTYEIADDVFTCVGAPFSDGVYTAAIALESGTMTLTDANGIISIYHHAANLP